MLPRRSVPPYKRLMKTLLKRPALFGAAAFGLTVGCARVISYVSPRFHVQLSGGVHLHHYVIGIFMLTVAGYLALIFKGPRATFGIALLYGLAVALTFDEFGFWFNPPFVRGVRWNTDGLLVVGAAFLVVSVVTAVAKRRRRPSAEMPAASSR
jgi:hypothetical protein